jgi:superfamily II DNA/RNA helicase
VADATLVAGLRSVKQPTNDELSEKLDAWIERELYPESALRDHYKKRVVFHHAQMPPRVRLVLEEAIRGRKVDIICATTTLAEGVNFPFSTVIVETLVSKEFELSPRALWNIAGRAGRFGVDSEGHCILFRPSLWEDELKNFELDDYLKVRLVDVPPVKSALATGMERLDRLIQEHKIEYASLGEISLSEIKIDGKRTKEAQAMRALVNIMRVAYAHASTSHLISLSSDSIDDIDDELLAARCWANPLGALQEVLGRSRAPLCLALLMITLTLLRLLQGSGGP